MTTDPAAGRPFVPPPPHLASEWSALTEQEQQDVLAWATMHAQLSATERSLLASYRAQTVEPSWRESGRTGISKPTADKASFNLNP
jgi:hypothetical protein